MKPWIFSAEWSARLTLIFLIACFYLGIVTIHDRLFFWAADAPYRHWFYPPAGIRLILIMLFGWLGVTGYFMSVFFSTFTGIGPGEPSFLGAAVVAAADALSLWAGVILFGKLTGVRHPWDRLSWHHVPFLALFVSIVRATVAEAVRHVQGTEILVDASEAIRNVSLYAIGDTLGTIAVLFIVISLRRSYQNYVRGNRSDLAA